MLSQFMLLLYYLRLMLNLFPCAFLDRLTVDLWNSSFEIGSRIMHNIRPYDDSYLNNQNELWF